MPNVQTMQRSSLYDLELPLATRTDPTSCAPSYPGLPIPEALWWQKEKKWSKPSGLPLSPILPTVVYIIQILSPQRPARDPFTLKKQNAGWID